MKPFWQKKGYKHLESADKMPICRPLATADPVPEHETTNPVAEADDLESSRGGDAATVEVIARGFSATRRTDQAHLLLGLTVPAMRDFTRAHPRDPNSHICPNFCRKWDEPGRSERGWTKGSDELPRVTDVDAVPKTCACPKGHCLEKFDTPNDGYVCSVCTKDAEDKSPFHKPTGTTMYSCRACNYGVCETCFAATCSARCAQCAGPLDAEDARGCPGCAW